ncbi:MAG: UDP-N-acetylmuramoyl-L-alanyl-D-glutamate--2,6-diaminopimelate ligase [Pseudomonadota bacterium]
MKLGDIVGTEFDLSEDQASQDIKGITADSRDVKSGYLFAALPGTQVDGAKFIPSAIENGAAMILVCAKTQANISEHIPVLKVDNPRKFLAHFASRFYSEQPEVSVAVTGTNGKTSVVSFVRQIWQLMGLKAASMGTTGLMIGNDTVSETLTTPEPVTLHKLLQDLAMQNITHVALEASSHGLQQHRVDGVCLKAAAFTNISQDHLDYHVNFEHYFSQKLRLFSEVLPQDGIGVVNVDDAGGAQVVEALNQRGLEVFSVGRAGKDLRLVDTLQQGYKQILHIFYDRKDYYITLPLVGAFQASNALVAAGLCLVSGAKADLVFQALENLNGAKGRLEHMGQTQTKAQVFIDYAHTPDALENVLLTLQPYVGKQGGRLFVVFGCGGDRDKGKRPLMGQISAKCADVVYVTDDNPRSENPEDIRSEILDANSEAIEIGDRRDAISDAIQQAHAGDIIVVAGKGHETGQIMRDKVVPFSDHEVVMNILNLYVT